MYVILNLPYMDPRGIFIYIYIHIYIFSFIYIYMCIDIYVYIYTMFLQFYIDLHMYTDLFNYI